MPIPLGFAFCGRTGSATRASTLVPAATQMAAEAQSTATMLWGTYCSLAGRQVMPPSFEVITPPTGVGGLTGIQTVPTITHATRAVQLTAKASSTDVEGCSAVQVTPPSRLWRMIPLPGTTTLVLVAVVPTARQRAWSQAAPWRSPTPGGSVTEVQLSPPSVELASAPAPSP